jgi:hypothetical protein
MPNHIQNRIQFIGHDADVDEKGKEMQIDFNKIKPMPDALNITSDGWVMCLETRFKTPVAITDHLDKIRSFVEVNPSLKDETVENFIKGIRNYIDYGVATWYEWAVNNWGTKWNAYGQNDERNNSDTIYFETAWSSPINLIARAIPQSNITLNLC